MEANFVSESSGIKFLVATDIHLGHQENHPQRGNDSFNAFQEVLEVAKKQNVDFLLLGGDLFDQVNPSQQCIYRCLNKLKGEVFGQKQIKIHAEIYNDKNSFIPNFANENISIKLPIFTIHGNHDYPTNDFGRVSICDLLHASNYVNYFGKQPDLTKVKIKPLIISKGNQTKLAIYGLGYIKDSILHNLFFQKRVQFQRVQGEQKVFCLFILHQNRFRKGQRIGAPFISSLDSSFIPQWMDLTIWGHEHQAIGQIQQEQGRKIVQPGSTVITSFITAQSHMKQVVMINTGDPKGCYVNFIKLQRSFRPMFWNSYQIQQLKGQYGQDIDLYSFMEDQLQSIISQFNSKYPDKTPIIRLKVQLSKHDMIRFKQLQAKFGPMVANKQKIFHFWKRKKQIVNEPTEKQFYQAIRNKQYLQNNDVRGIQEIISIMAQKIQNHHKLAFYDQKKMLQFIQKCVKDQPSNTKGVVDRYFQIISKKSTQTKQFEIQQFKSYTNKEFNKAVQQRITNIFKNTLGNETPQQRVKRTNMQINLSSHLRNRQLAHEMQVGKLVFSQPPQKQDLKKQPSRKVTQPIQKTKDTKVNSKPLQNQQDVVQSLYIEAIQHKKKIENKQQVPKRPSILKRRQDEINISHMSQQQDCCQRAAKTQYKQKEAQFQFKNAQQMIQNNKNKKKKRNSKKSVKFINQSDIQE